MVVVEDGPVRCSECGTTYSGRVLALGSCPRCGSRRLNVDLIEPVAVPSVRQFEPCMAC